MTTCHFNAIKTCDILHASEVPDLCQGVRVQSHTFHTKAWNLKKVRSMREEGSREIIEWMHQLTYENLTGE